MPDSPSTPPRNAPHGTTLWSRRGLLPLMIVVGLLLGAMAPAAGAKPRESRVHPQLQREAGERPNDTFRVIVTRLKKAKNGDNHVRARGGRKLKDLKHDAFVAELRGSEIAELGRNRSVKFVAPDAPMVYTGVVDRSLLVTNYADAVNATSLWSGSAPITGAGVGVAVIDTGINNARPDFRDATGANRVAAKVLFNAGLERTTDGHGHGTHVAGVIAGNSWWRTDAARGKYIGIAPEAKLINVRVADENGMSYISDVVDAIDWVVAQRQTYNIRVLNLSMVSSVPESYKTSTLSAAVQRAWFNGILVVVAAGNAGPDTMGYPPANDPFVVTVGASDTMGTAARADDGMAPWSSYGTTQDGVSKPDVVAPGRYIVAPLASTGSTLAQQLPDRLVDGAFLRLSGTSMAAPIVSGIAALAFQAHPEWSNDQVKWLLRQTATGLGGANPLPGQGAGEVDAAAVVRYSGMPDVANQNTPISEHLIGPNGALVYTNPSSTWSTSTWSTSTWSTSTWSTSTWSTSTWSTSTWSTTAKFAGTHIE